MESLTYEKLVPRLVEAVPEATLDPDDVADNQAYLVFNDLMRFVIGKIQSEGNSDLLERIFGFIEAAAQSQDVQVQDVLEDALYQIAVASVEKTESAKIYMGPSTQGLLRKLEKQIYQR